MSPFLLKVKYCDMQTHFWAPPNLHERNNEKFIARIVFYVVRATSSARQRFSKHIPAEANARNSRDIARQRRGK
jgi:hypothetical protein